MTVRVRIAPSPTGIPHVGTAYMALFNIIFARHFGGKFIVRIEDTDQKRSRPEYETCIFEALHWLGLTWDEGPDVGGPFGPYRQSERTEIYRKYCDILLKTGKAYKCFATAEELSEMRQIAAMTGKRQGYDRRYRNLSEEEVAKREAEGQSYVIRLKIPLSGDCVFEDGIKGTISFPWADIDDQILMKSDGFPTYHLANVVDDHLMEISHVIRGDEWMSSTPKHIYLYEAFGWTPPTFMHMPLLFGTDGKKLSKRRNPISIFYYKDSGYLPEAMCNFFTLMGYSMPDGKEMYSLDEIVAQFDPKRIGISPAVFALQKLDWLNQQYIIKNVPQDQLWDRIKEWNFSDELMHKIAPLAHSRMKTLGDFFELAGFLFVNHLPYSADVFAIDGYTPAQCTTVLQAMIWALDDQENWNSEGHQIASKVIATRCNVHYKKVVIPLLYVALMGKKQGLPLFDSAELLGKDRVRARLLQSIEFLGGISSKKAETLKKAWDQGAILEL